MRESPGPSRNRVVPRVNQAPRLYEWIETWGVFVSLGSSVPGEADTLVIRTKGNGGNRHGTVQPCRH